MKAVEWPSVTLLIAAYNEREILMEKLRNSYALRYPADSLEILFVTDGSTDGSEEVLQDMPLVRIMHRPERRGKLAAVNRAIEKANSEIIVLTDANCFLNEDALINIVRHYRDPKVGAVSGEKRVQAKRDSAGRGEGLYWRYESFLKRLDSQLNSVVGAAGELFSFRKKLYHPVPADTVIEDFALSMDIAVAGHRVVYEPDAIASEAPSANLLEEWKRKVRICAGGFQAIGRYAFLFRPERFNLLSFQFLSHRVLRWAIVPFFLPLLFFLSGWMAWQNDRMYGYFFFLQCFLYGLAACGLAYLRSNKLPALIGVPYQFVMMNAAAYAGLIRFLRGNQSAVWEKVKRSEIN